MTILPRDLRQHVVKSPRAGYVEGLQVSPGQQVFDTTALFSIKVKNFVLLCYSNLQSNSSVWHVDPQYDFLMHAMPSFRVSLPLPQKFSMSFTSKRI